ncbi:MAG TPA: mannose-1-phosphate guanylyltransferase/mannose-6-phosphate isomerase [Archaeoglobaceae archaeon]|nr:mannose-1-phosphate guanylyltransferase/mannose-6-phosphate isomerase [Archaeoglobaceae archaeon]
MRTVILAGGSGTRLWPLSREAYPKQFIKLFDGFSLFEKTVERALIFSRPEDIYIVTNQRYEFDVTDALSDAGVSVPDENILLEPASKNTLPAIYFAIKKIEEKGESKVIVLPSDHFIEVSENYRDAFEKASELAEKYLVTFGIKPTKPHTGYGYIKLGKKVGGGYIVEKFVEKPDSEKAKKYLNEGYLWNSGMFMFKSGIFMEECEKYQPEIVKAFESENPYEIVPEISIDYGLMEKTDKAAVVSLDIYWNDVGSFDAFHEVFEKDENQNAIKGECIAIDSENNFIIANRLVGAVGIKDTIIVDTRDSVLVCSRKDAQKVKEIVSILKSRGDERAEIHRTTYRPWGSFTILEEGSLYKIKKLTVLPGKRLSLQKHYHRNEHWVVVKGVAKVTVGDKTFMLERGSNTFIPAGSIHRLENPGKITLEVIEVQIGEYLGEDDIERFQDDFGRA